MSMMSGGGKGGGGSKSMAPEPAPQIQYTPDTSAQDAQVKADKSKAEQALLTMRGRSSTILTGNNLGTPDVTKRVALGG